MTEIFEIVKTRKIKYYNRGQLLREREEISGSGRDVGFVFGARTQAVERNELSRLDAYQISMGGG
jgi:hypothetical protein